MSRLANLWPQLDVRHLLSFQAVVERRSFGEAARMLGYTQSAVSQQVAALERIVGHRLFARSSGRGRVDLTPSGELFARHVDFVLTRLACARADLDAVDAGETAPIRVGAFQSISGRVLPDLVDRVNDERFEVRLTESEREDTLLAMVDNGSLDFAFTLLPLDDERFTSIELFNDPFFLAGSRDHDHLLAIDDLGDLSGTPIVAPRNCRTWERIAAQLDAAGVTPEYAVRTDDNFTLKALLQRGIGVAFITKLTLDLMGNDLSAEPIGHLVPPRRIALAWSRHRTLTQSHRRFIELIQEFAASLDRIANEDDPTLAHKRRRA